MLLEMQCLADRYFWETKLQLTKILPNSCLLREHQNGLCSYVTKNISPAVPVGTRNKLLMTNFFRRMSAWSSWPANVSSTVRTIEPSTLWRIFWQGSYFSHRPLVPRGDSMGGVFGSFLSSHEWLFVSQHHILLNAAPKHKKTYLWLRKQYGALLPDK